MKSIVLTFTFLISAWCLGFSQQISIQPSILEYRLTPGLTESQTLTIANLSGKKLKFEANLADWIRDTNGSHVYYRPDTIRQSCAGWVSLSKNFIELDPGQTENLIVKLKAPMDTEAFKEMKWAMLFLQSATEQDSAKRNKKQISTKINEILRIGIHIYQTPPQLNQMTAKALSLEKLEGEKNMFEFKMANTGNTMLQCKVHLELTNVANGSETKLDNAEFPVFPGANRNVKLSIPETLPKGKYSALAVLDLGEDMALEAVEKDIEIK